MLFETLKFIDSINNSLNEGMSVKNSLQIAVEDQNSKLSRFGKNFLELLESGRPAETIVKSLNKPENKALFIILGLGIKGRPVMEVLENFYLEVKASNELLIQNYHRKLPFKMLIPLMLFYFPALFLLFLGPFLSNFFEATGPM